MRKLMIAGVFVAGLAHVSPILAQSSSDEVAQLKQRVAELEKQVQELRKLVEPLKARQSAESRQKALRDRFEKKMADDRKKFTPAQLREAEKLYQVANQKWGTPEAMKSLEAMIEKYPEINRTGCATLYVAQKSEGEERTKYLQECIEKFNDCFYGDGVQVGAYARFLLAGDYAVQGEPEKAAALYSEIKTQYVEAVDHGGRLLIEAIPAESK